MCVIQNNGVFSVMVIVERWLSLISLEEIVRVLLIMCEMVFHLVLFKV